MKIDTLRYIRSHSCLKKVWLDAFKKNIKSKISFDLNLIKKEKKILLNLIKKEYKGLECTNLNNTKINMKSTTFNGKFSAKFKNLSCVMFAEILGKTNTGYDFIEVTNKQEITNTFKLGLSYKLWILQQNNINVNNVFIYSLNTKYTNKNKKLFTKTRLDIDTKEVPAQLLKISIIDSNIEPQIGIGSNCYLPVECPFYRYCTDGVTPCSTVFLDDNKNIKFKYIKDIKNIKLSKKQKLQRVAAHSHKIEIATEELNSFMYKLDDPSFLDIIYYKRCMPQYGGPPGSRVYYNSSIINSELSSFTENKINPHFNLLRFILKNTKKSDQILVWDRSTLDDFLSQLTYPKYKKQIEELKNKIVEFSPIFNTIIYHENFRNSTQLKYIYPEFADDDFDRLFVHTKKDASALHLESKEFSDIKKQQTRKLLQKYYDLNVIAMMTIFKKLKEEL